LVEHQQSLVADIERALGELGRDEEARRMVQPVLDGERTHRDALPALAPAAESPRRQAACTGSDRRLYTCTKGGLAMSNEGLSQALNADRGAELGTVIRYNYQ